MRLLIVIAFVALACAPVANAQFARDLAAGGESLSLENGRGFATVSSRGGTMLGSVGRGRVRVVDLRGGPATTVEVAGCETRKKLDRRTILCIGRSLRFSVVGGTWQVTVRGSGIDGSAVLKGRVTLQGTEGTYSIGHGDDRSWPRRVKTHRLG